MEAQLIEIVVGFCKICDAEIKEFVPANTLVEISDSNIPTYPEYPAHPNYRGMAVTMVRRQLFCPDCKRAFKKLLGRDV